jgi:hypothetical protein
MPSRDTNAVVKLQTRLDVEAMDITKGRTDVPAAVARLTQLVPVAPRERPSDPRQADAGYVTGASSTPTHCPVTLDATDPRRAGSGWRFMTGPSLRQTLCRKHWDSA